MKRCGFTTVLAEDVQSAAARKHPKTFSFGSARRASDSCESVISALTA